MTEMSHGFKHLRGLLTPDDIRSLRAAVTDSIDRVARALLTPYETSRPDLPLEARLDCVARRDLAYASALYQTVMADAQHDPRLAQLATHPALSAAVGDILGPDAPSGHVIRTRAAIRALASRISPWHQDVVRPDGKTGCARVRLACWIPLADVDETTGALELMPAAWQAPLPHVMRDDGHFGIPDNALPEGERRVIPMNAGDVLLLGRFVPHRARPTSASHGRWAIAMWVKTGGVSAC
jgi:hypothetical protein